MATDRVQHEFASNNPLHRFLQRIAVFCIFVLIGSQPLNSCPDPMALPQSSEPHSHKELQKSEHWSSLDGTPVKSGWSFDQGLVHLSQRDANNAELAGGHIITANEFEDFELEFEWKITKNGNSGIKYMVQQYGDRHLGLEYQIYDDNGDHKVEAKNSTGAIYDLVAPIADKPLKPAGEWNRSKIVVQDQTIEHWLNGRLIAKATMYDDEWQSRIKDSKFNDVPGFCKSRRGRLMLTDHGSDAWYRFVSFRGVAYQQTP